MQSQTPAAPAVTIAAISGSLRRDSFNTRLLRAAAHELPAGVELFVWEGLGDVPPFNEDQESGSAPTGVAALRTAVEGADGVLITTPEYNGAMPGQLKNALDWASRPRGSAVLQDKPVATMSASPTPYGAAWAQENLRRVLGVSGAEVTGGELAVPQIFQQFDEAGRLVDAELRTKIAALLAELAGHVRTRKQQSNVG